jgi:hypothetical protein
MRWGFAAPKPPKLALLAFDLIGLDELSVCSVIAVCRSQTFSQRVVFLQLVIPARTWIDALFNLPLWSLEVFALSQVTTSAPLTSFLASSIHSMCLQQKLAHTSRTDICMNISAPQPTSMTLMYRPASLLSYPGLSLDCMAPLTEALRG